MRWKGKDGTFHAVEWLADGQQWVCEGVHPSGKPYVWRHDKNLIGWGFDNLTKVEAKHVEAFFAAVRAYIEETGGTIEGGISAASTASLGERHAIGYAPFIAPDPDMLDDAMLAIDNNMDEFPDRNDVVAICCAFKAGHGHHADDHYHVFLDFILKCPGNDDDYALKIWESTPDSTHGYEFVFATARRFGWLGDVQTPGVVFDEAPLELLGGTPPWLSDDRVSEKDATNASLIRATPFPLRPPSSIEPRQWLYALHYILARRWRPAASENPR